APLPGPRPPTPARASHQPVLSPVTPPPTITTDAPLTLAMSAIIVQSYAARQAPFVVAVAHHPECGRRCGDRRTAAPAAASRRRWRRCAEDSGSRTGNRA